jgi:hypothetical protein
MEIIQNFFINNHGYLQVKELQRNSKLYTCLKQLVGSGVEIKIKAGLYRNKLYSIKNELK